MEAALRRLRESSDLSPTAWVKILVEEAVRLTGSTIGYFAVTDEPLTNLRMIAWSKTAMAQCAMQVKPIDYPFEATGLWGDCIREGRPVITNDYENCTRVTKKGYPDGHVAVKRHMNVAVMAGEHIKGILGVGNRTAPYRETEAALLQAFANAAWTLFEPIRERGEA